MLQSVDNDGMMNGYDLDLLARIREKSGVPIIVAGGAGNFTDLRMAFEAGADAAACGSLFNFGDNNPLRAKAYLKNYNVPLKRV
jgi:cyclase